MKHSLLILTFLLSAFALQGEELDENLAVSLKIEANHNKERLKSFGTEQNNNKIFDEEREKGLAEFLEDQEKWDLLRDRGLRDYRSQKRVNLTPQEGGPEYLEYLEDKESLEARYERSRLVHVRTRDKVTGTLTQDIAQMESDELGLRSKRPRYDLRKRSRNKWANSGNRPSGSGGPFSGSSPGFDSQPNIPPAADFVPAPEFPPAPPAFDAGDATDFTPPPSFDPNTGMPLDNFGPPPEINIPPPPSPTEFDF